MGCVDEAGALDELIFHLIKLKTAFRLLVSWYIAALCKNVRMGLSLLGIRAQKPLTKKAYVPAAL